MLIEAVGLAAHTGAVRLNDFGPDRRQTGSWRARCRKDLPLTQRHGRQSDCADARRYGVKEFSELAGVTVRTLHHYDRLGLLRARRTASGFRVYTSADLERLEASLLSKFIGLPLKQIGAVLAGDKQDLGRALQSQISALEEKKRRLDLTISTVRAAEATLRSGGQPRLRHIIEAIEMQNDHGWILQHFTKDVRRRVGDRLESLTPETWTELQRQWGGSAEDIRAALDKDPAAPETQALLSRWEHMFRQLTGGDQTLVHGLKSLYADRRNWPEQARNAVAPLLDERIFGFSEACRCGSCALMSVPDVPRKHTAARGDYENVRFGAPAGQPETMRDSSPEVGQRLGSQIVSR